MSLLSKSPHRRRVARPGLLLLCVLTLLCLAAPLRASDDELSQQDHDNLLYHLNVIANNDWPQDSISAANAILTKSNYSIVAWETFFLEYFRDYPFTDYLEAYLGYPVFWWFDDTVHRKLQSGLALPLLTQNIAPDWQAATAGGTILEDDPLLRQDLINSMRMLVGIGHSDLVHDSTREAIYDAFKALPTQHPQLLQKEVIFDRGAEPYFAFARAQAYMVLVAAAADWEMPTKIEIADAIDLTGDYRDIWLDRTLLFLENNLTDDSQREFLADYLSIVPGELHNLRSITVNDLLGNSTTYQGRSYGLATAYGGVNIFGVPIGGYNENSFPGDVEPGYIDGYCVVVAHEVNHVVDAFYVGGDPARSARKDALIAAAGNDHLNYLRSMFDDGFFAGAPQEFFASIANQWFADSAKTIELGLIRFDAGRPDPINQALFYADVYSLGGDATHFYTVDVHGEWSHATVPLTRDGHGHLNGLTFGGTRYTFTLDSQGDVTGYATQPACPADLDSDGDTDQSDLGVLLASYLFDAGGDLDNDGDTDQSDLGLLLADYGCAP